MRPYPPHGFVGRGTVQSTVEGFFELGTSPSTIESSLNGPPPLRLQGRI